MTSSPSNTRKSERLEKKTPSTPHPATRRSQRLEKQSTLSPLRRSKRGKAHSASTSPGSRSLEKNSSSLDRLKKKEKKEKSVPKLTMESVEVIVGENHDQESNFSSKRKIMDGHSYKALFKKQKRRYPAPDSHDKLEKLNTLPRIDRVDSGASGSKLLDVRENGVHGCGLSVAEDFRKEFLGRAINNENLGFVGNCTICSKRRRLDFDSPEQGLCFCGTTLNQNSGDTSVHKVSGNVETAFDSECAGVHKCTTQLKETLSGTDIDSLENVCVICKKGGKLLCCDGQSCRRCYHISCLDPFLHDDPPGVWHCSYCVKKKTELGVHIVSKGVESIWDVREVVDEDMTGIHEQKQYLVKYQGLSHVYNHWVPERQLLQECPSMVAKFNQEHENVKWNPVWRLPQRLLRKRRVMSCSQQDEFQSLNADVIPDCQFEWLVKWCGLDYDHATWEIDSMDLLHSFQGQKLVREYEDRRQKAKKVSHKSSEGAPVKLSKLPGGGSPITDDNVLNIVNKLREFWYNNQSAVIFDEQDRLVNVILFILSLSDYHQPFLVLTTPDMLSKWKAEFMRLAPSVDVVDYSGNWDTRRSIRTLEFYDEGGGIVLQLLLTTLEFLIEDIQTLKGIKWEAVIVDECQYINVNPNVELIKILPMNMRLLLFSGQPKDVAEYQFLLSLLDSAGDPDEVGGLRSNPNENIVKLKERLSQFIAYGSKFVEYWVPVPLSNLQLEQYCATLLANTVTLWSSSKKDSVGALLDILMTVRKCCNHPYIVNSSLQASIATDPQALESLSVGIKASGKLQFLDIILSKIRRRKLRVLILFQANDGAVKLSTGDMLDDFLCQRFGKNSYERFGSYLASHKKQAAMDRFNSKEGEQFVFLLESRAYLSSIKLSVDFVVLFDSEWNPVNDIRVLQKVSIESESEQIKVFRLYSSYTLEEKVLILSKHHTNLHVQNKSRATGDILLMWGASCLFSRLDHYHTDKSVVSAEDFSSGQEWVLDDVVKDFMAKLLDNSKHNNVQDSIISKAFRSVGVYHTDCLLLGERELKLPDEERQTFWKKLLEGRHPRWKFLSGPGSRSRKRVQYAENDEEEHKGHKVAKGCITDPSLQPELGGRGEAVCSKAAASVSAATSQCLSSLVPVTCASDNANKVVNILSQEISFSHESDMAYLERTPSNEQNSLHTILRAEMAKLCQILKISEDAQHIVEEFLEYIMENHHVNQEPASILHAFQMSLCWIAASILKEKIDKRDSLVVAKQAMDFQCTEEEAYSVYRKLRSLKRAFLQLLGKNSDSIPLENVVSAAQDISEQPPNAGLPPSASFNLQNVKVEVEERPSSLEPLEHAIDDLTESHMGRKIKRIQKRCDKHMLKLCQKQEEEIKEFSKKWEQKRLQLEGEHKLELAFIRTTYNQSAMRMDKLKMSDDEFKKIIQEHEHLMEMQLKELEARHAAAREEESRRITEWLAKMKSCISQCTDVDELHFHGSESNYEVGFSEGSGLVPHQCLENKAPSAGSDVGEKIPGRITQVNQASERIMSDISVTAGNDAFDCTVHSKTVPVPINRVSDEVSRIVPAEASSIARVEQPKELSQTSNITPEINAQDTVGLNCSFYGMEEIACIDLAASKQQNTGEISLSCQNNEKPSRVSSTDESEIGRTIEVNAGVKLNTRDDKGNSMGSVVLGNLKGGTGSPMFDTVPSPQLQPVDQILVPTFLSELPQQCDECLATTESVDTQEHAPVTVNQTTSVGFASCTTPFDAECSVKSNYEAQMVENSEQLQPTSDCSSPVCSQPIAAEVVYQGQIEGSNCLQTSEASPQLGERSVELCHPAVSLTGENIVQAIFSSSPICSQPLAAEVVHHGHIEGINSLWTSEASPHLVEGSVAATQNGESSVHLASGCSSPFFSQCTDAEPVHQGCIEGINSVQTSEASSQLVEGLVELSHQPASQTLENLVQPDSNCCASVCHQPIAAEPVHQAHIEGSNSLHTSEASHQTVEGLVGLPHQTVSQIGENLMPSPLVEDISLGHYQNDFDLLTVRTDHENNGGLSAVCQNNVSSTQAVENAAEPPNQAPQQLVPNLAIAQGPTNQLAEQSHRVASLRPILPLHAEPLQNELERIRKELEQTIMNHDSTKLQLKSDCDKEIEEMIAQIRGKYEAKLKYAESSFQLKKTELDSNHNKVLMNKILAEAFQYKCLHLGHSRSPAMQQAASSSLIQHMHRLSTQPALGHPSAAILSPASQPAVSQQIAVPPVQSLHRSAGLFPSIPPRPPQISAITPSTGGLRVGGEIRAPAPHLQPFRPPACMSGASISCLPCNIPSQQIPTNLRATSVSLPSVPTPQPFSLPSQFTLQQNSLPPSPPPPLPLPQQLAARPPNMINRPQPEFGKESGRHNPSLSAVELLMDIDNQAGDHLPNILQHLAGSGLNTNALDQSAARSLVTVDGNMATPPAASNVVCLSDDD